MAHFSFCHGYAQPLRLLAHLNNQFDFANVFSFRSEKEGGGEGAQYNVQGPISFALRHGLKRRLLNWWKFNVWDIGFAERHVIEMRFMSIWNSVMPSLLTRAASSDDRRDM